MMSDTSLPPPPPQQPPVPPPDLVVAAPGSARAQMTRGIALSEEQRLVLAVFTIAGVVLCIAELFIADDWLPGLFGMFLIVYAAIVVAGSLPAHWISSRLDNVLDRWVRDRTGSGFYGMVALGHFAHAELHDVIDLDDGLFAGWDFVTGSIVQHLIGFSMESITNMISAFLWPFRMFSAEGAVPTLVFGLACWAVFQVGRNFLPVPDLTKPEDPTAPKKKRKRRWY